MYDFEIKVGKEGEHALRGVSRTGLRGGGGVQKLQI